MSRAWSPTISLALSQAVAANTSGDWRGHVALVVGVHQSTLELIGGNEGWQVRRTIHDVAAWPLRRSGGLWGIATLDRANN